MRAPTWFVLIVGVTALLSAPGVALGQTSDLRDEEARSLFQAGESAFTDGRLEEALQHFQRSFDLSGRTELLFNIANVQDRLRHGAEAMAAYERFVEAHPESSHASFARNRARALREEVATTVVEESRAGGTSAAASGANEESIAPAVALLVGGGALVLAAIGTTLWAADRASAADTCANEPRCVNLDVVSTERDAAIGVSIALGVVGIAGLIGGAVWLAGAGEEAERAAVSCIPGGLAVACAGHF